jgi:hypothetical protein
MGESPGRNSTSDTGRLLDGLTLEGSGRPGWVVRKETIFPDTGQCEDLKGRRKPRPKRERGTNHSASTSGTSTEGHVNPTRVEQASGDGNLLTDQGVRISGAANTVRRVFDRLAVGEPPRQCATETSTGRATAPRVDDEVAKPRRVRQTRESPADCSSGIL